MSGPHEVAGLRARWIAALSRRMIKPRWVHEPDPLLSRELSERLVVPPAFLGVRPRPGMVGGVPGEWLGDARAAMVVVYVHGGAYAIGSPATHRHISAAFARRGFRVFSPAYRLAPEHRFPAALDDVVATIRGCLDEGIAAGRIAVAGDSSGAGLALAALVRLRELDAELPAAAALFSPWADLAFAGASITANALRDPMLDPRHGAAVARHYLGDTDPRHPLVSPVYADLAGLPPLLIHVGDSEVLLDDSLRIAERARTAGTEVELKLWEVVPHGWQLMVAVLPEARRSLDEAATFFRARAGEAAPSTGRRAAVDVEDADDLAEAGRSRQG